MLRRSAIDELTGHVDRARAIAEQRLEDIRAGLALPPPTLARRASWLAPHFRIRKPNGDGPFPVVLMLHGCGGIRPFTDDMAEVAAREGAVAIEIDSYAPRKISRVVALATVCTGARLHGRERAGDLFAALHWVREQGWADPKRVVAAGWSHGSWAIMDGLALHRGAEMRRATGLVDLPDEPLEGLAAALLTYPYSGAASYAGRRNWRMAPRSIAILAGRDHIVGVRVPREALEKQKARGAPIEIVHFPDATHAFEDGFAEDPRIRFDPELVAREHALLCDLIGGC
jgi:dienelactone hydrolase